MLHSLCLTLALIGVATSQSSTYASTSTSTSTITPYENCEKYAYSCVDKNNKCKGDFYSYESMELCNNGNDSYSCCKMPLHCSLNTGKCVLDNAGEECASDDDCFQNYFSSGLISCVKDDESSENGTCVAQGNVGDACKSDAQCFGQMKCVGKVCAGVSEGGACVTPRKGNAVSGVTGFVCEVGTYCHPEKLVCTKKVGENEACESDFMCAPGLVCNSGMCVSRYSLSEGDNCTNDDACGLGYLCEGGECVEGMNYKYTECHSDSDCVINKIQGTCDPTCHHAKGKHFCHFPHSSECKASYKAAYDCLESNGCSIALNSEKGACGASKCAKAVAKVYGCKSHCGHYRSLLGGCAEKALKDKCPSFSDGVKVGSTVGVAVAILAVLVATFIIARVMKTEDPYAIINEAQ